MNRSRRDRWPKHDPSRWVFIDRGHITLRPYQGYVVDWHRNGSRWKVLVAYVPDDHDAARFVQEWFPAKQLRPMRVDPNEEDYNPF